MPRGVGPANTQCVWTVTHFLTYVSNQVIRCLLSLVPLSGQRQTIMFIKTKDPMFPRIVTYIPVIYNQLQTPVFPGCLQWPGVEPISISIYISLGWPGGPFCQCLTPSWPLTGHLFPLSIHPADHAYYFVLNMQVNQLQTTVFPHVYICLCCGELENWSNWRVQH